MNRARFAKLLAPIAPPCFASRMQWVEYVEAAAISQRLDHEAGPLVFKKGSPVSFNAAWSFCEDCTQQHRSAMLKRDQCDPEFVRAQITKGARSGCWKTTGASSLKVTS